ALRVPSTTELDRDFDEERRPRRGRRVSDLDDGAGMRSRGREVRKTRAPIREEAPHRFSKNFIPSEAIIQGMDEADFELGYELPDPPEIEENFIRTDRDGTAPEGRKTNRNWDELE